MPTGPRRVVAFDAGYATDLATLGVPVVGTVEPNVASPELVRRLLSDAERVGTAEEPNLERIAALRPDLIVTRTFTDDALERDQGAQQLDPNFAKLERVGPTVALPYRDADWRGNFEKVAAVTGRGERAHELAARAEAQLRQVRREVGGGPAPTVSFVRVVGGEIYVALCASCSPTPSSPRSGSRPLLTSRAPRMTRSCRSARSGWRASTPTSSSLPSTPARRPSRRRSSAIPCGGAWTRCGAEPSCRPTPACGRRAPTAALSRVCRTSAAPPSWRRPNRRGNR